MPKQLESGTLYVSKEFSTAAHLCACGCGNKVRTPLGPTDWQLDEDMEGPSLYPSIGNWQQPCRSHYWIQNGKIEWADSWTPKQILDGRRRQEARAVNYYESMRRPKKGAARFWNWLKSRFKP